MNKRLSILTTLIVLLILCGLTMETHAEVVGYWSFNNSEHIGEDASPNHNHGELTDRNRAKWVRSKAGGALQLDGGPGLEVPHDESLNLKDQLTLMCWVKFADIYDFARAQRSWQQSLIWKSAPGGQVSYGLYVNRGQLELDLPLYVNNPGILFSWLYVIDPKCRGQFINGIPDFPARCQRKFAFGLADSKFGNLGFRASMPGAVGVHAVHPTFFATFFPVDNFLLDEDDKDFLKEQEQKFVGFLSHVMIGTSGIYAPRIIRHFENLNEIWFHFAAVADGERIRLYVDGKEKISERQGSDRQPEPFITSQEPLMIGTGLDGVIDEVMILDQALTENEIKEAMELGKIGRSLERFLFDAQGVSVVAPDSPQIYWTDETTGSILRTNLNDTNAEELVTGLILPDEIALDEASSKMYWATKTNLGNSIVDKIQRANLDGTHVEKLVTTTRNSGDGIALDMVGGKIYWASSAIDKIQRANLDGTHVQIVELKQVQQWLIEDITLDVAGGKMYWTAFAGGIQRANLDGTDAEKLIDFPAADIALDVAGGKIYWVRGKIQRANLDGTNIEDLVLMDGLRSKNIALDVVGGKMYWTNMGMGKIQRANLDGTHVEDVVTGLSRPTSIALALSTDAPEPVPTPVVHAAADVNQDKKVNKTDLLLVVTALGEKPPTNPNFDVNDDGTVNIADVLLVIEALDDPVAAAAPSLEETVTFLDPELLRTHLGILRAESDGSLKYEQAIAFFQGLLASIHPTETRLLANYPNPFNPETWIPYQLAKPADVTLRIYATDGRLVRTLELGHQPVGNYESRSRAAYWDGRNALDEPVASGVYFYTLSAGDFTATRKMLIQK